MICGGLTLGGCKVEFVGRDANVLRVYREGKGHGLATIALDEGRAVAWDGGRFAVLPGAGLGSGAIVRPLGADGWARLKRLVPQLASLRWPAAAVATIPVIEKSGAVVSYTVIDQVMRSDEEDVPRTVREAWEAWSKSPDSGFEITFCGPRLDW